jgi:hypothetical protein
MMHVLWQPSKALLADGRVAGLQYKLAKVRAQKVGDRGIPYISTSDGRTIRYPDPLIKVNDTVKIDIETGKVVDFVKFDVGNVVTVTGGRNRGRVGVLQVRTALAPPHLYAGNSCFLAWRRGPLCLKTESEGCYPGKSYVACSQAEGLS